MFDPGLAVRAPVGRQVNIDFEVEGLERREEPLVEGLDDGALLGLRALAAGALGLPRAPVAERDAAQEHGDAPRAAVPRARRPGARDALAVRAAQAPLVVVLVAVDGDVSVAQQRRGSGAGRLRIDALHCCQHEGSIAAHVSRLTASVPWLPFWSCSPGPMASN